MICEQIIWYFKAYINICHFFQLNQIRMNSRDQLVFVKQNKGRFYSQVWFFSVTVQLLIAILGICYSFKDTMDPVQKFVTRLPSFCSALIQCGFVTLAIHLMTDRKLILLCGLMNQTLKLNSKLEGQ